MPRDLREDELIHVRDSTGTDMPFSKGIMATSILATGLETYDAYRIAADIRHALIESGRSALETRELAQIAAAKIAGAAGAEAAARYRAWRKAKRTGRPVVVCLSGAPGVGKSTLATRLAVRLGISRVVPTDAIRDVLRTVIPDTVLPELHVSSFEASGPEDDGPAGFLRQARAVSAATAAVANRLVAECRSVILEGVHLLPGEVEARLRAATADPILVERLLVLPDAAQHRARLARRAKAEPDRGGHRHLQNFAAIRAQQDALRRIAARAGVPEHDIAHPEDLTQQVVDDLVERAALVTAAGS